MRLAYLAHLPECDFDRYGFKFDRQKAEGNIRGGAFSTIEGAFLKGFIAHGGLDIHVISFSPFVSTEQTANPHAGLTIHLLPAVKLTGMVVGWIPRALKVRKLLDNINPDIVHGMRNLEGYGFMAVFSGRPHLVTIEEFLSGIDCLPHMRLSFWIARQVERWVIHNAKNLVSISNHVKNNLLRIGAKGHIESIPNVAADVFYTVQKRLPKHLLYVGRICPEKGLLDIIHALALPGCRSISPKLVVVGGASGPNGEAYLSKCKDAAQKLLIPFQVEFQGPMQSQDIAKLHETAIALVMPSVARYEGMPVVIVEALAAGTPVITYDFGPMPEFVVGGKTGYIVDKSNIPRLAIAINHSVRDALNLENSSRLCREATTNVSIQRVSKSYYELFHKIFNENKESHPLT
jgi:glycosyltransferase involved in cell wall biosynthesis